MDETRRVFALAGNPNVGKSTVFNALTGLRQHTGNWTGKTVGNTEGRCRKYGNGDTLVDLPGCYSLTSGPGEEAAAGDYISSGISDAIIVVADATNLERNLILLLQTLEISGRVVLALNLLDEAEKKHISVDKSKLSQMLGIPVIGIVAKNGRGLRELMAAAETAADGEADGRVYKYPPAAEAAVAALISESEGRLDRRGALRLLTAENSDGTRNDAIRDEISAVIADMAASIASECVSGAPEMRQGFADRVLTGRFTAFPAMLVLLACVFWITLKGANYPSELLSRLLFEFQDILEDLFVSAGAPGWLTGAAVYGMYRTTAWVTAVMLPPMAVFFPLFTLLEDLGYLPRVAFNLDRAFRGCDACGKQALTMCMGIGCNAAGVTGCRIIDSPRERLIAILTNNFMPCNGRFPMILSLAAAFASESGSALALCGVMAAGTAATLASSKLLSKTLLRGSASSFVLELPPFRRPQILKTLARSLLDRTLHVLGRAVMIAAPAGVIIYVLANSGALSAICAFFDPFAEIFGLDGVILSAFLLGIPANEIVLPIIMMGYSSGGYLAEPSGAEVIRTLLTANGWTAVTAVCTVTFSLMHWPCSTTLITVWKETHSLKWTSVSALLPTLFGLAVCLAISLAAKLLL